jgi:murein DD-endopeptidase MepM/ murein hydrolase activator NlpD
MSGVKKDNFWEKMRFEYRLSFLNENTLEEVFSFRVSRLTGFIAIFIMSVFLITLTAIVIIRTPIRNYLPGYLPIEVRQEVIDNALKVDSLENALLIQAKYLNNVRAILNGTMEIDEIRQINALPDNSNIDLSKSQTTADFIHNYEEEEKFNLDEYSSAGASSQKPAFYKPVKGMLSSEFNIQKKHYGVDVAATPKEPVMATMKGTVIFTGFDPDTGYVMQIQHDDGYISIYKHNAKLLKVQGEEVRAGEAIALAGNTGNLSTGSHLHFELWYNGKPIDPCDYINFK